MKKVRFLAIILSLALLTALAGCGSEGPEENTQKTTQEKVQTSAPAVPPMKAGSPNTNATAAPVSEENPAEETAEDPVKKQAEALVGNDVQELYDAIGYPISSDYASSCLGPGEDGELIYEGFVVYTYREGNSEKVQSVE